MSALDLITITKAEASARQIDTAVKLFLSGELVPAITLAGAAEESLPDVEMPYLLRLLNDGWTKRVVGNKPPFNEIRNWLKHEKEKERFTVHINDAVIMLVRAVSKYTAVYGEDAETHFCKEFQKWMRTHRADWLGPKRASPAATPASAGGTPTISRRDVRARRTSALGRSRSA